MHKDNNRGTPNRDKYSSFVRWSFWLALVAVAFSIFAVAGHRLGIMDFSPALFMLVGATAIALLAVFSGIIGIIATYRRRKREMGVALAGLILGLVVAVPVLHAIQMGARVPGIHDITTDFQDPPKFAAIRNLRTSAHNSLDRRTPADLASLQQAAYPDLGPVVIQQSAAQVFEKVFTLAKARGWGVVAVSAENGTIEATDTTPIMGFKDDIVIRVQDKAGGAIVDMRSVSRVGKSDLGTNAARIKKFLVDLSSGE